jgi:hypothetical protein
MLSIKGLLRPALAVDHDPDALARSPLDLSSLMLIALGCLHTVVANTALARHMNCAARPNQN